MVAPEARQAMEGVSGIEGDRTAYYAALCKDKPVEVHDFGPKGKGLKATRAIEEGAELYVEQPLVSLQHIKNRRVLQACDHCMRSIGSLVSQMNKLLMNPDSEEGPITSIPLMEPESAFLAPVLQCNNLCSSYYCSEECRDAAWEQYHGLLCGGSAKQALASGAAVSPLIEFMHHAVHSNEIYLLAAKVIGYSVHRWYKNGKSMDAAKLPFSVFHQRPWHEVVMADEGCSPGEDPEMARSIEESVQTSLMQSFFLLREGILARMAVMHADDPMTEAQFDGLIPFALYSKIVGMFELNNLSVEISSPVIDYFVTVSQVPASDAQKSAVEELHGIVKRLKAAKAARDQRDAEEEEEDDDDDDDSDEDEPATGGGGGGGGGDEAEVVAGMEGLTVEGSHIDPSSLWSTAADPSTIELSVNNPAIDAGVQFRITSAAGETEYFDMGLFPGVDGTAIFAVTSSMNHSCKPNVSVQYRMGDRQAVVVARESIKEGQELLVTYIDEEGDYEERQEELRYVKNGGGTLVYSGLMGVMILSCRCVIDRVVVLVGRAGCWGSLRLVNLMTRRFMLVQTAIDAWFLRAVYLVVCLRHYGFVCECEKCTADRNAEGDDEEDEEESS